MTDEISGLFEDEDLSDEAKEQIAAMYHSAIDEGVARELSEAIVSLKEELVGELDEYLHESLTEMQERLDEAVEGVVDMIVTAVDTLTPAQRDAFYRRAARKAQQTPPLAPDDYPGNHDQNGAHRVPNNEAERNRGSLKPGAGRNDGIQGIREDTGGAPEFDPRIAPYIEHLAKQELAALEKQAVQESADDDRAREALRDHLHAVEKARKDQYHARLMEYVERKEEQSRGVLRG